MDLKGLGGGKLGKSCQGWVGTGVGKRVRWQFVPQLVINIDDPGKMTKILRFPPIRSVLMCISKKRQSEPSLSHPFLRVLGCCQKSENKIYVKFYEEQY